MTSLSSFFLASIQQARDYSIPSENIFTQLAASKSTYEWVRASLVLATLCFRCDTANKYDSVNLNI